MSIHNQTRKVPKKEVKKPTPFKRDTITVGNLVFSGYGIYRGHELWCLDSMIIDGTKRVAESCASTNPVYQAFNTNLCLFKVEEGVWYAGAHNESVFATSKTPAQAVTKFIEDSMKLDYDRIEVIERERASTVENLERKFRVLRNVIFNEPTFASSE